MAVTDKSDAHTSISLNKTRTLWERACPRWRRHIPHWCAL